MEAAPPHRYLAQAQAQAQCCQRLLWPPSQARCQVTWAAGRCLDQLALGLGAAMPAAPRTVAPIGLEDRWVLLQAVAAGQG